MFSFLAITKRSNANQSKREMLKIVLYSDVGDRAVLNRC